ncbi:hypothetical protein [Symbiopectobacterium purcellii]|uniref:hypothetical protein n=1 Tax=Symbiopectobacterium purcellii TaxID=2871826 RepID=UPI003F856B83
MRHAVNDHLPISDVGVHRELIRVFTQFTVAASAVCEGIEGMVACRLVSAGLEVGAMEITVVMMKIVTAVIATPVGSLTYKLRKYRIMLIAF